jgi:hypothetical protein
MAEYLALAEKYERIGGHISNQIYRSCCFVIARQHLLNGNLEKFKEWNDKYNKCVEYKINSGDCSVTDHTDLLKKIESFKSSSF